MHMSTQIKLRWEPQLVEIDKQAMKFKQQLEAKQQQTPEKPQLNKNIFNLIEVQAWVRPIAEDSTHFDHKTWKSTIDSDQETTFQLVNFPSSRRFYVDC